MTSFPKNNEELSYYNMIRHWTLRNMVHLHLHRQSLRPEIFEIF